jgi:hypothetical protein
MRRCWNAQAGHARVWRNAIDGGLAGEGAFSVLHVAVVGAARQVVLTLKRDRPGDGHLPACRRCRGLHRGRRGCRDRHRGGRCRRLTVGGRRGGVLAGIRLRVAPLRRWVTRRRRVARIRGRRCGSPGWLRVILFFWAPCQNHRQSENDQGREGCARQARSHARSPSHALASSTPGIIVNLLGKGPPRRRATPKHCLPLISGDRPAEPQSLGQ